MRQPGSRQQSLRTIRERLSKGWQKLPPVDVSEQTISATYRRVADDRQVLYKTRDSGKPNTERLDATVKRLLNVAERETARVERSERGGKLDANRLLKLARAIRGLYDLQERSERHGSDPGPEDVPPESPDPPTSSLADRLAAAVPDDHPDQGHSTSDEGRATGDGPATLEAAETMEVERTSEEGIGAVDGGGSDGGRIAGSDFARTGQLDGQPAAPATTQLHQQTQS